jgi:hypothetical protein
MQDRPGALAGSECECPSTSPVVSYHIPYGTNSIKRQVGSRLGCPGHGQRAARSPQ